MPTISGTAQVGETLTADVSSISDADGLTSVLYSYQWIRSDTDISGETASTYELSDDDVGKAIKVRVTFDDDAGNSETLTSAATATVAATAPGVPQRLNVSSHDAGALDLYWEAPGSDGGSPITGYKVQWKQASGSWDTPEDVSGETVTGTSHTLTGLTAGAEYTIRVIASNSVGDGPASVEVAAEAPEQETAIWSAVLTVGVKDEDTGYSYFTSFGSLSKTGFTVDDANYTVMLIVHSGDKLYFSLNNTMTAGFVLRVGAFEFASVDASPVEGGATYLLEWDQPGLSWSEGDRVGVGLTLSEDSHRTVPDENNPATGLPVIRGTARVGETLTADTSGIADEDGLTNVWYSYQWIADDADIEGATNSTYTLAAADEDKAIKVEVSFTDDGGNEETLTSAATAAVEPAPNSPATGQPAISGTAQVRETLTADTSGITDEDGLDDAVFSHQWIASDGNADADIQDATGSTYTLAANDEGKTIKVKVTFTDDGGNEESLTSSATAAVEPAPNSRATGQPDISGTARVGETLTADVSGIDDADGLDDAVFSYQWIRNDGTVDTQIQDARDSTYVLDDDDEGTTIKVRVTFTDDRGHGETLTSAATDSVAGPPSEPLTVSLENEADTHDGETPFTFELRFSEEFDLSYVTLRDHAFTVVGGTVEKAQRMAKPSNIHWRITVQPDSNANVTITLPATGDCGDTGAICTEDGRKLSNRLELTVSGPDS